MPIKDKEIWPLIENVYEAALDESIWYALAPQIGSAFGSTSATLLIQESGQPKILTMTENIRSSMDSYKQYFWDKDVWVQSGLRFAMPQVRVSQEFLPDAEFQETEFYREWVRHIDIFHMVGSIFRAGQDDLGVIAIHRPRSAGSYQEEDKTLVARFLPHLQRALQIRKRLGQASELQRLSLEALSRTDTAIILVAADGRIIFANPDAEALLTRGRALRIQSGRLAAATPSDTARLLSLIRSASNMGEARNEPGGVMAIPQANALPLTLMAAPFRSAFPGLASPSAIVFIRDPNRSLSAAATLQALFRLTPTEARIAQALADGKTIAEIAADHRATLQTVRKQLKIIFTKTGTNRQAQCVAVILRSVATISRG